MANNDFRSLLSTFQAATGEAPPSTSKEKGEKDESLKQLTEKMWRLTQIKSATAASTEKQKHNTASTDSVRLAICLCIVDTLPHEEVWKWWISDTCSNISAELYIHAKHPNKISSSWVKSKLLAKSYHPNWNDVRIVRAMLLLIEKAIQDPKMTHVVFGTESCLPICTLHQMSSLVDKDASYVAIQDSCTRFDEMHCFNVVAQYVPYRAICKALPGWCTLCRAHAQAVLDIPAKHLQNKPLWPAFAECWAPEEVYFPTALSLLGLRNQVSTKSLTYAEWDHKARNHSDRAHPKDWFDEFGVDLVKRLRRDGCLFMRKISRTIPLSRWEQAVMNSNDQKNEEEEQPCLEQSAKRQKRETDGDAER